MTWRDQAECRRGHHDPEIWFSDGRGNRRKALRICGACPVAAECLAEALAHERAYTRPIEVRNARYGIWGGTTPAQRELIEQARRRTDGATGELHG